MSYSRNRGPDRWIRWKMALFGLAAIAFFVGVRFDQSWLVWVAVGLLVVGFLLRFAREVPQDDDDADDS